LSRPINRVYFVTQVEIRHGGSGQHRKGAISANNEERISITKVDGGIEFRWSDAGGTPSPNLVFVPAHNIACIEYGPEEKKK
jgi:hypothetical protein